MKKIDNITIELVTKEKWNDVEKLFGKNGACGGCWCMYWRLKRSIFAEQQGEGNKESLKKIIQSGEIPGLIAYSNGEPVGWCSVGPREVYPVLDRSPVLKRIDEKKVWSIVCFFVAKPYRKQGITERLIRAAIDYAKENGAKIIEAYPATPKREVVSELSIFTGLISTYKKIGFVEVARRSEAKAMMRYYIEVPDFV